MSKARIASTSSLWGSMSQSFVLKSILHTPSIVTCLSTLLLLKRYQPVIRLKSSLVYSSNTPWIIKPSTDDFNATIQSLSYLVLPSFSCCRISLNILEQLAKIYQSKIEIKPRHSSASSCNSGSLLFIAGKIRLSQIPSKF